MPLFSCMYACNSGEWVMRDAAVAAPPGVFCPDGCPCLLCPAGAIGRGFAVRSRNVWRVLLLVGALALLAATVPISGAGAATGDGYMYEIGSGGQYAFDQGRQTDNDSSMDALVKVYLDGDWAISGSLVDADAGTYTLAVGVAGTCVGNTELFDIVVTADPGVTMFNWVGTPPLPLGYDFIRIYKAGAACLTNWSSYTATSNHGEITAPDTGEVLFVGDMLTLGAKYYDDDYDALRWAVRIGTCDMVGGANVAGNQTGFFPPNNTPYSWDGMTFGSTIDTSSWAVGDYCFIFNPANDGGENQVRLTRWFSLVDAPTTSCPSGQVFVDSVGSPTVPVAAAAGYPYDLTVEGTYYANGDFLYDIQADAKYSQDAYQRVNALPWTDLVRNYEVYGEELLEMKVDGLFKEWGAFAADHSYTIPYTATGSAIDFQIYDLYSGTNNIGGLCVDVEPVALRSVSGGGQIIEEVGPKAKDDLKVSFGGHIDDIDGGLVCEWQVNLHNVNDDDLDGSKFHTTLCTVLNTWPPNTASDFDPTSDGVTNFTAIGTFDGVPGYSAIFRMEDYTEPGAEDTFRVTINGPSGLVYDTHTPGEFSDESHNVGTARTLLDNGNIQISFYE